MVHHIPLHGWIAGTRRDRACAHPPSVGPPPRLCPERAVSSSGRSLAHSLFVQVSTAPTPNAAVPPCRSIVAAAPPPPLLRPAGPSSFPCREASACRSRNASSPRSGRRRGRLRRLGPPRDDPPEPSREGTPTGTRPASSPRQRAPTRTAPASRPRHGMIHQEAREGNTLWEPGRRPARAAGADEDGSGASAHYGMIHQDPREGNTLWEPRLIHQDPREGTPCGNRG